jgi:hypothetical protein
VELWLRDVSGDCVHVPGQDEDFVPPDQAEVLRRVATGFRRVEIDWFEGERYAEARLAKGIEVGVPEGLRQLDVALFRGRTALVSVADAAGTDAAWVRFYLTPHPQLLELYYDPASAVPAGRAVALRLAELLGFEFATWESEEDAEPH